VTDSKSRYENNNGVLGGAISASNTTLNFSESIFQYNSGNRGGVMHLESNTTLNAFKCTFAYNGAYLQGGVIFIATDSYFYIDSTEMSQNWANDSSVLFALGTSTKKNLTLTQSTIISNTAVQNAISLTYVKAYFLNSQFTNNYATRRSKNIFVGFSDLVAEGCIFRSQQYNNASDKVLYETTSGTYFYIVVDSNV
jgi:hypothetical protein